MEILASVSGEAVPLSEVPDEVFAEGMAGEGGAIVPAASGEAVAPVSGTLAKLCSEWSRLRNGLDGYVILLGNRKLTNLARKPFTFLNSASPRLFDRQHFRPPGACWQQAEFVPQGP